MTKVFSGNYPTELYKEALSVLLSDDKDVKECKPRGKRIKEVRPAIFEFNNPNNRVTFAKGRVVNPFFQIAESLWILAGRSDVEWLAFYNKNMKNFSDDGVFFNAPYGERLRSWNKNSANNFILNPIDQLLDCYTKLKEDNDTRQAVAVISNPMFDNSEYTIGRKGKDIACLSGDTIVNSPEGDIEIRELARRFAFKEIDKYPVYSFNENTKEKVISYATHCWKTKTDTTYEVELNNGNKIRATAEHLFYVRRYRWVEVISKKGKATQTRKVFIETKRLDELKEGDVLVPLNITLNRKGERSYYPSSTHSGREGTAITESMAYCKFIYGKKFNSTTHKIFHRDYNCNNNSNKNMLIVTNKKYIELQAKRHPVDELSGDDLHKENFIKFNKNVEFAKKQENRTKNWYMDLATTILEEHGIFNKELVYDKFVELQLPPSLCLGEINKLFRSFAEYKTLIQRKFPFIDLSSTEASMEYKLSPTRIKSIKIAELEPVYDMTVADTHCFFANNILVHNCNLIMTFKLRDNKLDISVFNRSNDLHWGTFGANLCQFTTIQSAMASWLGAEVGSYYQITDSLHIYLDDYGAKETTNMQNAYGEDLYKWTEEIDRLITDEVQGFTSSYEEFHNILRTYFNYFDIVICRKDTYFDDKVFDQLISSVGEIPDKYFQLCVYSMIAYHAHKEGNPDKAMIALSYMPRGKWQVSCLRFLSPKYSDNLEFIAMTHSYGNQKIIDYIMRKDK